jgi:hypothetical protein
MAKNPEPDKTSQAEGKTPQAGRSIDREREAGTPASSGTPASKEAARPKSPREFIHERMRQLDKKGP